MSKCDVTKLEEAIAKMLEETLKVGKLTCFFDERKLLASMHVSTLSFKGMKIAIEDILSGTPFNKKYGAWVFGNYESGVEFLTCIASPREKVHAVVHHVVHEPIPRTQRKKYHSLEVPRGMTEEEAQKLLNDAIAAKTA